MKHGFFAVLAILCLGAAALPACAAGEVTFTFQPPEKGLTYIATTKSTKTEKMSSEGDSGTKVTVSTHKSRIQYVKTATGYTQTETLIATEETVNGETEADDFYTAMLDMPVEVDFDAKGVITAIRGMDAVLKKLLASMAEPQRSVVERVMTREKMENLIKADWASNYIPLYGQTKKPGDIWNATTREMVFSSGLMPVKSTYTFLQADTALGRPCVQLKVEERPDVKAVASDLRKFFEEIGMFPKGANPKITVTTCTTDNTCSIDPLLLTTLRNTLTKTKKYTVTYQGHTITFDETEKSTTTTAYESVWRAEPV
ncbi:MAG TPA: DUF6263 family protein [Armatimonadota bacterium]|jgi:hypothetical protein